MIEFLSEQLLKPSNELHLHKYYLKCGGVRYSKRVSSEASKAAYWSLAETSWSTASFFREVYPLISN